MEQPDPAVAVVIRQSRALIFRRRIAGQRISFIINREHACGHVRARPHRPCGPQDVVAVFGRKSFWLRPSGRRVRIAQTGGRKYRATCAVKGRADEHGGLTVGELRINRAARDRPRLDVHDRPDLAAELNGYHAGPGDRRLGNRRIDGADQALKCVEVVGNGYGHSVISKQRFIVPAAPHMCLGRIPGDCCAGQ